MTVFIRFRAKGSVPVLPITERAYFLFTNEAR